jgi:hypothetical protein
MERGQFRQMFHLFQLGTRESHIDIMDCFPAFQFIQETVQRFIVDFFISLSMNSFWSGS